MEASKDVKTTFYLTLDDEDVKNMAKVINLAREQIAILPDGAADEIATWARELEMHLDLRRPYEGVDF